MPPGSSTPLADARPADAFEAALQLCHDAVAIGPAAAGERSWWFNAPFIHLAEELSEGPADLAVRLSRGQPGGRDQDWHAESVRVDAGEGHLIVVVPAHAAWEHSPANRRDPLTDLPDRRWLIEQLQHRLRHPTQPFALLFIDLDGFKQINDRLGHIAGDRTLQEVARRLQNALRDGDTVSRFGGDEFVVLAEGVHHANSLPPIVERLNASLAPAIEAAGDAHVGISVGAALSTEGHTSPESLLHAADQRMYQRKRA